jgi:hypothetical protein
LPRLNVVGGSPSENFSGCKRNLVQGRWPCFFKFSGEKKMKDKDRFDRLVVFDVIFCLMDADGNQLKDDDGNTRVFCNHHASYDDLVDNALGDSDIADVVNQSRGWRETKNPFAKENKND